MPRKVAVPRELTMYQTHGIPFNVLSSKNVDPTEHCVSITREMDGMVKHIAPSEQKRVFVQTIKYPTKTAYTYLITAKSSDLLAKIAAFQIYRAAHAMLSAPHWHTIDGSFTDKLRDDESYRSYTVNNPNLLVITGLAINSTAVKFDKCRDILEMYTNIPRVIVAQGEEPFVFNEKCLFTSINRVMHFN